MLNAYDRAEKEVNEKGEELKEVAARHEEMRELEAKIRSVEVDITDQLDAYKKVTRMAKSTKSTAAVVLVQ